MKHFNNVIIQVSNLDGRNEIWNWTYAVGQEANDLDKNVSSVDSLLFMYRGLEIFLSKQDPDSFGSYRCKYKKNVGAAFSILVEG